MNNNITLQLACRRIVSMTTVINKVLFWYFCFTSQLAMCSTISLYPLFRIVKYQIFTTVALQCKGHGKMQESNQYTSISTAILLFIVRLAPFYFIKIFVLSVRIMVFFKKCGYIFKKQ